MKMIIFEPLFKSRMLPPTALCPLTTFCNQKFGMNLGTPVLTKIGANMKIRIRSGKFLSDKKELKNFVCTSGSPFPIIRCDSFLMDHLGPWKIVGSAFAFLLFFVLSYFRLFSFMLHWNFYFFSLNLFVCFILNDRSKEQEITDVVMEVVMA